MSGTARRFLAALRLALLAQRRGGFFYAYALVTATAVGVMRFLLPSEWVEAALPVFLLVEPGILGIQLVGAQCYLERVQRSDTALAVSPLRPAEHLAAMTCATALVAAAAGVVTFVGVVGLEARALLLVPPLFLCTVFSGLIGFAISLRHDDFSRFIMGSIPWTAVVQVPLLAHLGAASWAAVVWVPTAPALLAFRAVVEEGSGPVSTVAGATLALAAAVAAAFALVLRMQQAARLRGAASAGAS